MAHSPYTVVRPPPRRPPPDLLSNFTVDGRCPLIFRYYNGAGKKKRENLRYSATVFRKLLKWDNVTNIKTYNEFKHVLKPALVKYSHLIYEKRVAVIGTLKPWAEAMLLNLGANSVTTVEYAELIIEHKRVTTITPYRLASQFISSKAIPFDTVFSYSSLEHSGMGRYGDPLTPFGDLEATAQVWCMVKPHGHFILGVPVSKDRNKCLVKWNAHRIYGAIRLQHLTANWRVLDEFQAMDMAMHRIYVLQRVS